MVYKPSNKHPRKDPGRLQKAHEPETIEVNPESDDEFEYEIPW